MGSVTVGRPPRFPPDRKPKGRPVHPTRHVWTLQRGDDTRVCEIHPVKLDDWDLQIFDNGWLSYAQRVRTHDEAQQLADSLLSDCLREQWIDASSGQTD